MFNGLIEIECLIKINYFCSEEGLKDTIVLDPVWMIDAVKTIITAEPFAIRKPRLDVLWKDFRKSGVICKSAISMCKFVTSITFNPILI